jgi:hypothetical protein
LLFSESAPIWGAFNFGWLGILTALYLAQKDTEFALEKPELV